MNPEMVEMFLEPVEYVRCLEEINESLGERSNQKVRRALLTVAPGVGGVQGKLKQPNAQVDRTAAAHSSLCWCLRKDFGT